ncbi:two-component hyrid sensor and regulator [Bordetella ansorpii]|uniref:histidine kinase n=2 Tax=Bordetella ansorpii TaxID=288768 RepID=A0A157SGU8_9BORD|nr:two-component hyrid sensor and regulator [Bordetella ansorpii]
MRHPDYSDEMAGAASSPSGFLAGGGEMGALMRAHDWRATPLGPPGQWPQSLQTAVRIMLSSSQPIWIGWGPELYFLYNDPYKSAIIGGKHPGALGLPIGVVWREIWPDIEALLASAMQSGEGVYNEAMFLLMERNGYPEETYYTFSYSPIPDERGRPAGLICANSDDTRRVIGERQLSLLRELGASSSNARSWREACELSARALSEDAHDMPFALLYLANPQGGEAMLAGAAGLAAGHPAAPEALRLDGQGPWPLDGPVHQLQLVPGLRQRFGDLPAGPWKHAPDQAAIVPLPTVGENGRMGLMIVGLNPYRLFDTAYRDFLTMTAAQIGATISAAYAYEEERRRAEALAELDRAKTAFFSNISHEFRTPLTLMLGPLEELLARGPEQGDAQRELIQITHRNGMRLLTLVNSLLDFSRIEARRVQVNYQPTDLSALTAELASLFRSAMDRAGLELVVDCPPLPHAVYVDREMWEKIVLNLMSNAFKFTMVGSVAIRVSPSPDGGAVRVEVRDTGIGIPAHELPRVFDRFHRVAGAAGRSIEGSGIGLALVQELVRLQGGCIRVDSQVGRGTAFTVELPWGEAYAPAQPSGTPRPPPTSMNARAYVDATLRWLPDSDRILSDESPPGSLPMAPAAGGEPARVLVVDDNADLRDYMSRILRAAGYRVETAVDGEAALRQVRADPPDVVLSDIMMPRLDGFGLLAALRNDTGLRGIPVLLLSARAGEEARVEGLDAGADDYLTKPFAARELLARVASNLQLARVRQESAQRLREETRMLELLNQVGVAVAAELDLGRAVQIVTDAATELTGAAFGSFFYNVLDDQGESYTLYALSGVPREAFEKFPMPRNTAVFGPTFRGEGIVRSDDIQADPRYGRNDPHRGMPEGHLPVRSYLAAPVVSRTGEVLGGLFFGHPEAGIFTEHSERVLVGIAAQAAVAIDNAQLYRAAQVEIAERTKAQAALAQLNEGLEQRVSEVLAERDRLWDLSEDLLVVADYTGRLLRFSPAWTRVLGYPHGTLMARAYGELVHPDDLPELRQQLETLRATRQPIRCQNRVRTADGQWRTIAWTLYADPLSAWLHGVGRDVTADLESAAALRQAEEALRMAQKMEAVGKLTGGVAHDFNNLLQVIGGNLQLLARDVAGNEKAEQRLRNAQGGVARGAQLASQLLAFGRRQPLAPKVVNLGRFIRAMDDMLRRALGDGVEIETVISGGLWNTLVDPYQVENALLNLAINARDAMNGHGRLTIEAGNALLDDTYCARHADVTPGQYVMVAVTDTGSGMTSDVLAQVFEPFFTTKPEGQGTGLGLSMVYGFVRQSNGHVKIYSEPGQGTTVRLYLPRERQEEDLETEVDAGPIAGGTETVLVVEDDEEVRATVVDLLSELGYRVLRAKDAGSALAIIESGMPMDLVFTDVVMPGPLRSPELARKARERLPNVAVLFTSGYTDNAIVHGGRLDEGIELLSKPYTREALARKIRHVLRNQQQHNAARQAAEQTRQPAPRVAAAAPRPPAEAGLQVLLVEDDELIRGNTAEMLGSLGHSVSEAGNAEEALSALRTRRPQVLITDVSLPGESGVELAERALRILPGLSVVFASGMEVLPGGKDREGLADAIHLLKPYSMNDLDEVMRRIADARRARGGRPKE